MLQERFPRERDHIQAFFKELLRVYRHFYRGKKVSALLESYRWSSYQNMLDDYFFDAKLKAILSATVGYIGVHPNRASAISMAAMLMSYFMTEAISPGVDRKRCPTA